jgi:Periplasmic component of the Tol biopolymer transport system
MKEPRPTPPCIQCPRMEVRGHSWQGRAIFRSPALVPHPDGRMLALVNARSLQEVQLATLDLQGKDAFQLLLKGPQIVSEPAVAPNGQWMAYLEATTPGGTSEIDIRPFPDVSRQRYPIERRNSGVLARRLGIVLLRRQRPLVGVGVVSTHAANRCCPAAVPRSVLVGCCPTEWRVWQSLGCRSPTRSVPDDPDAGRSEPRKRPGAAAADSCECRAELAQRAEGARCEMRAVIVRTSSSCVPANHAVSVFHASRAPDVPNERAAQSSNFADNSSFVSLPG